MDTTLIYAKTPLGEESVRQSTRVVQRNLRMVLVQVDGKLSVADLAEKLGNPKLVERALRELTDGGFIIPVSEGAKQQEVDNKDQTARKVQVSALSQFSTFGPKSVAASDSGLHSATSSFSSFGKPILPSAEPKVSTQATAEKSERPVRADIERERNPLPVFKLMMAGGVLVVALLILAVVFFPYNRFKPGIERAASGFLQTPVKVGQVSMSFFPETRLSLKDVSVGASGDARIEEIRIASPISLYGSGPKEIPRIDVQGATFPIARLFESPMLQVSPGATPSGVVIRQIHLAKSQLVVGDMGLRDLEGDLNFTSGGGFENASVQAVDRSLRIQATPGPQGVLLNIEGNSWRPANTVVFFDGLRAKGLLQKDRLLIESFDTAALGGVLKGNWLLDWGSGVAMAGDAMLTRLDCTKVATAFVPQLRLAGELNGPLRFRARGDNWAGMLGSIEASLDAEILRGNMQGVDLGEAARRGSGVPVRAGLTRFDRLNTTVTLNGGQFSASDLNLDAGIMTASGYVRSLPEGAIESVLTVSLQAAASRIRVPVRVSGNLPDLIAVSER